jgi:predicted ATPase/DNA-binding XRE family transcriptional regulator
MSVERFGDQLRRHRQAAGMTQETLAERSGLSVRGISDLERGVKQRPHSETVRLLAAALGIEGAPLIAFRALAIPDTLAVPSTLPVPLSGIIGRDNEIRSIGAVLRPGGDVRLVTLIGPGGVGKTRLAIELATRVEHWFGDGLAFTGLASLTDPQQVMASIMSAFGIRDTTAQDASEVLVRHLHNKQALVVLDNMEHLLDAVPGIAGLLARCRRMIVLATSRAPLRIEGERAYRIGPLPLPPACEARVNVVAASPAARLFIERAQAVDPEFGLTPDNAAVVTEICRRLDGLPLALQLAAGRMSVLSPVELAGMLAKRLDLLRAVENRGPVRHRTVMATIGWSYDLLSPEERESFRRLAVFAGGATIEAAIAVLESNDRMVAIDRLAALLGQSLLHRQVGAEGRSRYFMLELVRAFASRQLADSHEEPAVRFRHAAWFRQVAINAEAHLERDVDAAALDCLEADHANIEAALSWAVDESGDAEWALDFASRLWLYWYYRCHFKSGRRRLERVLAVSTESASPARAKALLGLGTLAHCLGDDEVAIASLAESEALARSLGNTWAAAYALSVTGAVFEDRGDYGSAEPLFREALQIFTSAGDRTNMSVARFHLGAVAFGLGQYDQSRLLLNQALDDARATDDPWSVAIALSLIGLIDITSLDYESAREVLSEALDHFLNIRSRERIADWCCRVGVLAHAVGQPTEAIRLFAAASGLAREIGRSWSFPEREVYERTLAELEVALPHGAFSRIWTSALSMSLGDAVTEASAIVG